MVVLQWTISQSTFYACKDTIEEERAGRVKKRGMKDWDLGKNVQDRS